MRLEMAIIRRIGITSRSAILGALQMSVVSAESAIGTGFAVAA